MHELERLDKFFLNYGYILYLKTPEGPCPLHTNPSDPWPDVSTSWKEGGETCLLKNTRQDGYTQGWNCFGDLKTAEEYVSFYRPKANLHGDEILEKFNWKPIEQMPDYHYCLVRKREKRHDEKHQDYMREGNVFLGSKAGGIVSGPNLPMVNIESLHSFLEVPE